MCGYKKIINNNDMQNKCTLFIIEYDLYVGL